MCNLRSVIVCQTGIRIDQTKNWGAQAVFTTYTITMENRFTSTNYILLVPNCAERSLSTRTSHIRSSEHTKKFTPFVVLSPSPATQNAFKAIRIETHSCRLTLQRDGARSDFLISKMPWWRRWIRTFHYFIFIYFARSVSLFFCCHYFWGYFFRYLLRIQFQFVLAATAAAQFSNSCILSVLHLECGHRRLVTDAALCRHFFRASLLNWMERSVTCECVCHGPITSANLCVIACFPSQWIDEQFWHQVRAEKRRREGFINKWAGYLLTLFHLNHFNSAPSHRNSHCSASHICVCVIHVSHISFTWYASL